MEETRRTICLQGQCPQPVQFPSKKELKMESLEITTSLSCLLPFLGCAALSSHPLNHAPIKGSRGEFSQRPGRELELAAECALPKRPKNAGQLQGHASGACPARSACPVASDTHNLDSVSHEQDPSTQGGRAGGARNPRMASSHCAHFFYESPVYAPLVL